MMFNDSIISENAIRLRPGTSIIRRIYIVERIYLLCIDRYDELRCASLWLYDMWIAMSTQNGTEHGRMQTTLWIGNSFDSITSQRAKCEIFQSLDAAPNAMPSDTMLFTYSKCVPDEPMGKWNSFPFTITENRSDWCRCAHDMRSLQSVNFNRALTWSTCKYLHSSVWQDRLWFDDEQKYHSNGDFSAAAATFITGYFCWILSIPRRFNCLSRLSNAKWHHVCYINSKWMRAWLRRHSVIAANVLWMQNGQMAFIPCICHHRLESQQI